ncbi:SRPBCC domain-containing protein [Solimonas flava]|uniref:SRPBCC domain-containing protein n=1 Tax=Solimonas flava TaxID=415849 RepID=UPI00041B4C6D|nr:SRPBCC domain-containing protein [Solimonas flava]
MRFVIEKTVEINAPAEVVWEVLADLPKYPQWNPFCIEARSTLKPGDPIDMKVKLLARPQAQREWMKEYVEGRRFAYSMKPVPGGALSSFRSHDVEPIDATRTRYRSYFHLQGWLRFLVLALLRDKLEAGFAGMTDGVRRRAEELWIHRQTQAGGG